MHAPTCGTGYAVRFDATWYANTMLRVTAPMQAPASLLGMALGWARAARLRASYWTTLRVAAGAQCGCPQVSVDVSKDIMTLEVAVLTLDAVHDVLQARICTTMRSGICTIWAAPVSASSTMWAARCSVSLQSISVERIRVPGLLFTHRQGACRCMQVHTLDKGTRVVGLSKDLQEGVLFM